MCVQSRHGFVTAVASGCGPMSSSRGLRIIGLMRALVSPSGSILVSLSLCLKLENFIIYVSLL
jgi:hypothetical protein